MFLSVCFAPNGLRSRLGQQCRRVVTIAPSLWPPIQYDFKMDLNWHEPSHALHHKSMPEIPSTRNPLRKQETTFDASPEPRTTNPYKNCNGINHIDYQIIGGGGSIEGRNGLGMFGSSPGTSPRQPLLSAQSQDSSSSFESVGGQPSTSALQYPSSSRKRRGSLRWLCNKKFINNKQKIPEESLSNPDPEDKVDEAEVAECIEASGPVEHFVRQESRRSMGLAGLAGTCESFDPTSDNILGFAELLHLQKKKGLRVSLESASVFTVGFPDTHLNVGGLPLTQGQLNCTIINDSRTTIITTTTKKHRASFLHQDLAQWSKSSPRRISTSRLKSDEEDGSLAPSTGVLPGICFGRRVKRRSKTRSFHGFPTVYVLAKLSWLFQVFCIVNDYWFWSSDRAKCDGIALWRGFGSHRRTRWYNDVFLGRTAKNWFCSSLWGTRSHWRIYWSWGPEWGRQTEVG